MTKALQSTSHPQPKLVVVHASLAEDVIEQVWEDCGSEVGVLIVGDPGKEQQQVADNGEKKGMLVKFWEEVWTGAEASQKVMPGKLCTRMPRRDCS